VVSKVFYFLTTFADSGLSVFGVRSPYEQPKYQVVEAVGPNVEIRQYAPRTVVETDITHGDQGQAFGRLFRYITGANTASRTIAMTVPVEQARLISMTVPVETSGDAQQIMRFYLPPGVTKNGAPVPTEAGVRVTTLPEQTLGVIRYSGAATDESREAQAQRLREALAKSGKSAQGEPSYFSYDPPFAIPFLRRNEVALAVR
jgi:hypothetical protein